MTDPDIMVVDTPSDPHDLSDFKEMNKRKVSWDERVTIIKKQFPSVVRLDWYKAFTEDSSLLGRLLNDILKIDAAEPGKPGKRPAIDPKTAEIRLRQMTGEDFTALPFNEAFAALKGNRSIRAMAHKVGLDRNYVIRLLSDRANPTADIMEQVAKAFHKDPAYFAEYRAAYIFGMLYYKLESVPEASVTFYKRLKGQMEGITNSSH